MYSKDIPWGISSLGQLSILMEVSSPKPGNVNRLRRFSDTGYRHFLTSATLFSRGLYSAGLRGIEIARDESSFSRAGIGALIKKSIQDVLTGLNKRNTILGTIILHVPIAIGAGITILEKGIFDVEFFHGTLKGLIDSTTVDDTIELYKGFQLTTVDEQKSKDWSQIHHRYDISNPSVIENIQEDSISLIDLFKIASDVDSIAHEWATYYSITLEHALPYLSCLSSGLDDLEEGIVRTFIWLLAKFPDGLIVKKTGIEKAHKVMDAAKSILTLYEDGTNPVNELKALDRLLRENGNILNPGSTADLTSAAVFCRLLQMQYD